MAAFLQDGRLEPSPALDQLHSQERSRELPFTSAACSQDPLQTSHFPISLPPKHFPGTEIMALALCHPQAAGDLNGSEVGT